jgi:hypothetical protein
LMSGLSSATTYPASQAGLPSPDALRYQIVLW